MDAFRDSKVLVVEVMDYAERSGLAAHAIEVEPLQLLRFQTENLSS